MGAPARVTNRRSSGVEGTWGALARIGADAGFSDGPLIEARRHAQAFLEGAGQVGLIGEPCRPGPPRRSWHRLASASRADSTRSEVKIAHGREPEGGGERAQGAVLVQGRRGGDLFQTHGGGRVFPQIGGHGLSGRVGGCRIGRGGMLSASRLAVGCEVASRLVGGFGLVVGCQQADEQVDRLFQVPLVNGGRLHEVDARLP